MEDHDLFGDVVIKDPLLRDKFIEPPFSVLDTKQGDWKNRKRKWGAIGIKSEVGRHVTVLANTFAEKYGRENMPEGSIFDPALCELLYHWFCPEGGEILDPFAGGSVRGIVANYLGFNYTGIDLRHEQIESNYEQGRRILPNNCPKWICNDADKELDLMEQSFDFVFSCPPYLDLEVYSDKEGDISNMEFVDFNRAYNSIIEKCIKLLKPNRFACFVVGDIRDKEGFYRGFVDMTKVAFQTVGAYLYNEAILLQPLGTAMLRANRYWRNKKLVKVHENVLIFYKGNPKLIREQFKIEEKENDEFKKQF